MFKVISGKAVQTPVVLGLRNDEWAEILSGLNPEDVIVGELTNELEDGARVSPL